MWRWLHIPTISISLPIEWLVEFEEEAARIRLSGVRRYTQQDVVRQTIKMGLVYMKMLAEQEEARQVKQNGIDENATK